ASGPYGAIHGASSTSTCRTSSDASASIARPLRRNRATARPVGLAAGAPGSPLIPNSRIDIDIQKIDEETRESHDRRDHERDPHDHRVIALEGRAHGQASHPGPREDRLRHRGAADQTRKLYADDRDDR